MSGTIHTNCIVRAFNGNLDFDTDTIKVLLTTSSYTPDKDHDYRDDVTNEVSGTGYTTGGATVTVTVTLDTTNDRADVSLGGTSWASSTITARRAVYYKSRGGASSADELILTNSFSGDVSTTSGTFTLNASTLRVQN